MRDGDEPIDERSWGKGYSGGKDDANAGHRELEHGPKYLLTAIHWWHPGAWLPPGETLTVASILVGLSAAVFIFMDPLRRALFRFPTWSLELPWALYYLLIPMLTTWLAWTIYGKTVHRPGLMYPRWYALFLAGACTAISIYGLVDRFLLKTYRGNPVVHGGSAVLLMSVLTLSFRFKRVFPFERMVQEIAPIALAIVLVVGLPLSAKVGSYMIGKEKAAVKRKVEDLDNLTARIRKDIDYPWNTLKERPAAAKNQVRLLEAIKIEKELPDKWVWDAANLLDANEHSSLADDLILACGNLADAVTSGLTKVARPRLDLPDLRADQAGDLVHKESTFPEAAITTADYHRQIRRLMAELDGKLPNSPAEEAFNRRKKEYADEVQKMTASFGENWLLPIVSVPAQQPLDLIDFAQTSIGNVRLAEFDKLKSVLHGEATRLLNKVPGCAEETFRYNTPTTKRVARTIQTNEGPKTEWIDVPAKHYNERVECYAYLGSGDGAGTLAQVHWTYRSDPDVTSIPDGRPPLQTWIYWEGAAAKDEVMDGLARAAKNVYGQSMEQIAPPSYSSGFRGSNFAVLDIGSSGRKAAAKASGVVRLRVADRGAK